MGKKIVVGIIGSGRIGKVHAVNIAQRMSDFVTIKTIADVNIDPAKPWIQELGNINTSKDYKEILKDPEIQAVLVCSSTSTHAQFSIECAQAKKHCFCEKPIDFDIKRIYEVLAAVKKAGIKYQIGFNRRFDHNFKRIREVAKSGEIGDIHIVKVTSRDPDYGIDYIRESAKAGGIYYDMTIHDFDMIRFQSGMDVEEVYAQGGALIDPRIGEAGDIDTTMVTMKFVGGALGYIDNSRRAVYGYDQRVEVFGTKGMAVVGNDRPSIAEVYTKDQPKTDKIHYFFLERYNDAFVDELKEFFAAIRDDKSTPVTGNDGLQAVLIAAAAKKSLLEHRVVKLSEVDVAPAGKKKQ